MKSALLKLHAAVFLWGFTGVLGRLISLNAISLVWYRLLIAIACLFVILKKNKQLQHPPKKTILQMLGIGCIIALHWVCFYGAIKYADVSIALVCLSAAGLFTALIEPVFSRTKIIFKEVLLGSIGIAGIFLIFHFNPNYIIGIVIGLTATLLSVIFSILNKSVVVKVAPKTIMLYELLGGFLLLTIILPFYITFFPQQQYLPSWADVGWLILLSGLCTILAMDLSLQALKNVSAFTQNLTLNLEPVYGIILAFLIYHENKELSNYFYLGFFLIIISVALQMMRLLRSKK